MPHKIVDTNVPLTAAGANDSASDACQLRCVQFVERVLNGEFHVLIDEDNEVLSEYGNKAPVHDRSNTLAGLFLIHLYNYQYHADFVHRVKLEKNAMGQYEDYPDNDDTWTTDDSRCKRFDADDKKWAALAIRFMLDTHENAPIVNAADRCWRAFEPHLTAVGVALEYLC